MSGIYPSFIDDCIGAILYGAAAATPLRATLVGEGFVFDPNHDTLSDITAHLVGSSIAVSVDTIDNGTLHVDPVTFVAVGPGDAVVGVVFYLTDGDRLVCHIDRRADTVPINVDTDGGDLVFTFDRLLKL